MGGSLFYKKESEEMIMAETKEAMALEEMDKTGEPAKAEQREYPKMEEITLKFGKGCVYGNGFCGRRAFEQSENYLYATPWCVNARGRR